MENWNAFIKFIADVKAGAIATVDGNRPNVRAMVFVSLGENGTIYTTTGRSTRKVKEIERNPNVSIFMWKGHSFFRAEGKADVSEDIGMKRKILEKNPEWKKYYPGGAEDPDFCLIKIRVTKIEKG